MFIILEYHLKLQNILIVKDGLRFYKSVFILFSWILRKESVIEFFKCPLKSKIKAIEILSDVKNIWESFLNIVRNLYIVSKHTYTFQNNRFPYSFFFLNWRQLFAIHGQETAISDNPTKLLNSNAKVALSFSINIYCYIIYW